MNRDFVVSGGEDSKVKIWSKLEGDLLQTLDHHDYIVWNVKLLEQNLITCSYDCSIAYLLLNQGWSKSKLSLSKTST